MTDKTFRIHEKLYEAIHAIVDAATEGLDPFEDEDLREKLNEQFRFWRRLEDDE